MNFKSIVVFIFCIVFSIACFAQDDFDIQAYEQYLSDNVNMSARELLDAYPSPSTYYRELGSQQPASTALYLDSAIVKYGLTADELDLLNANHFVVTERKSKSSQGQMFFDIYNNDLPVFLSTDAILNCLHTAYDNVLWDIEAVLLNPMLGSLLVALYESVPELIEKHQGVELEKALADVDLYVSMALSLYKKQKVLPQTDCMTDFEKIWAYIESEDAAQWSLFSERERFFDFSQFTVRGHYAELNPETYETLDGYFQAMMWLGRIDFWLSSPSETPTDNAWEWSDLQRMAQVSLLLNELLTLADAWYELNQINEMIGFFTGESDNLTPQELKNLVESENVTLSSISDSDGFAGFQNRLLESDEFGQKILSSIIKMDPFNTEPGKLPISYKLMGQRFVIDSYVLANVVFDRIVFNGDKVWRPMPDPLDAMFALGNDNALPLLEQDLEQYHYSQNLAGLRYLVDNYNTDFWEMSLYNVWLSAIRTLNPKEVESYPLFMQSAAWQQLKLNTQLASWAQLRHDNLLYAKQSYTGGSGCSFPHSYIEPNPEFFHCIGVFANKAAEYFSLFSTDNDLMSSISGYFEKLGDITVKLKGLAEKELNREPFSEAEIEYLQCMLYYPGICGDPVHLGWYKDFFYREQAVFDSECIIADVHTQPENEYGHKVGRVLHVGTAAFDMGFFIAPSPSNNFEPMVFVGPVMSYYELITDRFNRLTDFDWCRIVIDDKLPERPDWVNVYLADKEGKGRDIGRTLPSVVMTDIVDNNTNSPFQFSLEDNYPNPFNPLTRIGFTMAEKGHARLAVYDLLGREVEVLVNGQRNAGKYEVVWNSRHLPSGVYFYKFETESCKSIKKMTLVK